MYYSASHKDVHCEILQINLSVFLYITPMVVLVYFFVQTFLCLLFDLVSVSTSSVLWYDPKAIRNQFFVLFTKYNKTIVNDIFKITKKKKNNNKKKNAAAKSFLLGSACSINCYKNRAIYSQGYLYG